jgi:DNA-binding NarL/FixJ family response regulator
MIKIVLLDDQQLFLDAFSLALHEAAPSIAVIGAVRQARHAYDLVRKESADLLVSDLLLQGTDAASVSRELARRRISTGLLVLTAETNKAFVAEAIQAGVRGYVLKTQPLGEVISAITQAAQGARHFAPALGVPAVGEGPDAGPGEGLGLLNRLSRREREVFCQILHRGSTTREIARALSISAKTVETHRCHINQKLDIHSAADLIRIAANAGMLPGREEPARRLQTHPVAA